MNFRYLLFVLVWIFSRGEVKLVHASDSDPWMHFKKPPASELKAKLPSEQFEVTQKAGTERPFTNLYAHNEKPGIYVDILSGEPLYSSLDKYDSGTGWPSFTKPIEPDAVVTKVDHGFFTNRTEVRSKIADNHLGHVFDDGPAPTGKRYCMNSAALRFVPLDQMAEQGYSKYLPLFEKKKSSASK